MKIAILLIATGAKYWPYAEAMIASCKKYLFQHDIIMFTDRERLFDVKRQIQIKDMGYPRTTLLRYHFFLEQEPLLGQYDFLFYADADMRFVADVAADEICANGITATEHPGFLHTPGTPESRPESTAYVDRDAIRTYFCGGFNGGPAKAYLQMAKYIRNSVDTDLANGIVAVWYDESHLNRYLYHWPPAKILSPAFCYPDVHWRQLWYWERWRWVRGDDYDFQPKLMAIDKDPQEPGADELHGLEKRAKQRAAKRKEEGKQ